MLRLPKHGGQAPGVHFDGDQYDTCSYYSAPRPEGIYKAKGRKVKG